MQSAIDFISIEWIARW